MWKNQMGKRVKGKSQTYWTKSAGGKDLYGKFVRCKLAGLVGLSNFLTWVAVTKEAMDALLRASRIIRTLGSKPFCWRQMEGREVHGKSCSVRRG